MAPDSRHGGRPRRRGRGRDGADTPGGPTAAAEAQKHPRVPGSVVRLTSAAVDDLDRLFAQDPQDVRWALKKMLLLERDPNAGEPLLAGLIGWRKVVVGDRDRRVVWRVETDELGQYFVEVSEVWAVGARKDSEVYDEVRARVAAAGDSPTTRSLLEVVERFGKTASGVEATPEPEVPEPVPVWLRECLLYVVRLPAEEVDAMTTDQAHARWEAHIAGQGG